MLRRRAAADTDTSSPSSRSDPDDEAKQTRLTAATGGAAALILLLYVLLNGFGSLAPVRSFALLPRRGSAPEVSAAGGSARHVEEEEEACDDAFRPGSRGGGWPLIDDALPAEGLRLELVATRPTEYSFKSSFCDEGVVDSGELQRALLDRVGGRGDGGRSSQPDHVQCSSVRFYVVDQETKYSDKIVEFLTEHEGWIIELFTGLLSATSCKPFKNGFPYYCVGGLTPEFVAGRTLTVLDYGANAGFFTQMAARLGFRVIAVDPQPHCVQFVRAAVAINGVTSAVEVHHAFLSAGGVNEDGKTSMPLHVRTGCMGTWPAPDTEMVRAYYDSIPGGDKIVQVPLIDPASLIGEDDLVVLAKIDVEGYEVNALGALEPHMRAGRILNLMVEINKKGYSKGMPIEEAIKEGFTASFPVFIKLLKELREMGFGVLSAQFGKHEWSLNTQLTWSTSAILNADDEIIEKYITDGWYVSNVLIALRRTDA